MHAATGRNAKAITLHEKLSFLERNGYARHTSEPPGERGGRPGERWYSVEQDDAPAPSEATKNDLTEETSEDAQPPGVDSSDSFFVASSRNGHAEAWPSWVEIRVEALTGAGMSPEKAWTQAVHENEVRLAVTA